MRRFIIAIVLAVIVAAPVVSVSAQKSKTRYRTLVRQKIRMSERTVLQTSDGITIVGDWISGDPKKPVALLLHMMPANRTSWRALSAKFSAVGIGSLAIDLRGHGESLEAKLPAPATTGSLASVPSTLNYKTFTDAQHQASRLDVDAALLWLKAKGYSESRVMVIGASIGANLAIDAAGRYPEIKKVVMLSGGLDFRGVMTESSARQLPPPGRGPAVAGSVVSHVLLVASADDDYSLQSHRTLAKILGNRATVKEFSTAGHGTTMFAHEPKLIDEIVQWVTK